MRYVVLQKAVYHLIKSVKNIVVRAVHQLAVWLAVVSVECLIYTVAVMLAIIGYGAEVRCENIDYGSLQSLFGEPVTTSATGTPQRASEVAAGMTIITADEIRQSGSRNIPDIISRVPGIDILRVGFNTYDVGVRGYQQTFQPRLLVLIDGRQVFVDDYSRTLWNNLPVNIDDIRQIEVVKGAASALFGSNAASGVINIVTYSPLYDNNNVANVTAGTQNNLSGDATVTTNGEWGGTKFSAGGLSANEFTTPRFPLDANPPMNPNHNYFNSSSVFKLSDKVQINTEATYSHSVGTVVDPTDFGITASQPATAYSLRAGADWVTPYGLITSKNYYNHSDAYLFEATDGGLPYGLKTDLYVSQLQDQFKIGSNNTFRAGIEYRYKEFMNTGVNIVPQTSDLAQNNYAVSGMWLYQVTDDLSWTNAARLDHEDMGERGVLLPNAYSSYADYGHVINTWSANSDIVYKASQLDTFRLGYGRGVQLPSLMQNGWNINLLFAGSLGDYEGNPKLKPTVTQDFGFDYSRKVPQILSDVNFSVFYEKVQDIVAPFIYIDTRVISGITFPVYIAQNVGDSHGFGGEVEMKGHNEAGFRWDTSYSYSRITDSSGVLNMVNYDGSAPAHHFRVLLGYSAGAWEFDTNSQYVTSTNMLRSSDGGATQFFTHESGYYSLGGRIGYKINDRFTVSASGNNLTRPVTPESAFPAVERTALISLTGKF